MAEYVHDCPRCPTKHSTFDIKGQNSLGLVSSRHWSQRFEIFATCRACGKSSIFILDNKEAGLSEEWSSINGIVSRNLVINKYFNHHATVNISDLNAIAAPKYLPEDVLAAFNEGAKCLSVSCWNASGAMFRTCIDLATKALCPPINDPPKDGDMPAKVRRNLGLRLPWLFEHGQLAKELKPLADCIQQDGNDGAHDGSLTEADALDLQDFAFELLERLYTLPKKLELADQRRVDRRSAHLKSK